MIKWWKDRQASKRWVASLPPWRHEWDELAGYNSRKMKGLAHDPAYVDRMERVQREYDEAHGRTS